MKGIIIYKGKYGATQQYAEWAGEELNLPVFTPENVDPGTLAGYDFVAIGTSVYIGKFVINKWLKQQSDILKNKKLFVFVVCGTPAWEKEKQEKIALQNIPSPLMRQCEIFFLPGRITIGKLSWIDKLLLKMGASMEKDPIKKKAALSDTDGVKKENLLTLIKSINNFTSAGDKNPVVEQASVLY